MEAWSHYPSRRREPFVDRTTVVRHALVVGRTLYALAAEDERRGTLLNVLCAIRRVCDRNGAIFAEARVTELARQTEEFLAVVKEHCLLPLRWREVSASTSSRSTQWPKVTEALLRQGYRREAVMEEACASGHLLACRVGWSTTCFIRWLDSQWTEDSPRRTSKGPGLDFAPWDSLTLDQVSAMSTWYNLYSLWLLARAVEAPKLGKWFESALSSMANRVEDIFEKGFDSGLETGYVDLTPVW